MSYKPWLCASATLQVASQSRATRCSCMQIALRRLRKFTAQVALGSCRVLCASACRTSAHAALCKSLSSGSSSVLCASALFKLLCCACLPNSRRNHVLHRLLRERALCKLLHASCAMAVRKLLCRRQLDAHFSTQIALRKCCSVQVSLHVTLRECSVQVSL